jgi:hypothetical protein
MELAAARVVMVVAATDAVIHVIDDEDDNGTGFFPGDVDVSDVQRALLASFESLPEGVGRRQALAAEAQARIVH